MSMPSKSRGLDLRKIALNGNVFEFYQVFACGKIQSLETIPFIIDFIVQLRNSCTCNACKAILRN